LAHLSPLGWEHVNLTGDYVWHVNKRVAKERFRPLRKAQDSIMGRPGADAGIAFFVFRFPSRILPTSAGSKTGERIAMACDPKTLAFVERREQIHSAILRLRSESGESESGLEEPPRFRRHAPRRLQTGGVLAPDAIYVDRTTDDEMWSAVQKRAGIAALTAPLAKGKSSMLLRLSEKAALNRRVVWIDLYIQQASIAYKMANIYTC
jgi:hypothetical protein